MLRIIKILLGILGGLFWTALMLSFADTKTAVMTIISALLHEAGHISALVMIKKKFSLPKLVASGFRIKTESSLSYKEEIIICAAGPLTNIIIFVFCLPHTPFFAVINLATAISNLLLLLFHQ